MMQRYREGSSMRSDKTGSSSDAGHDDVFGNSAPRNDIFPAHMVPSTAHRVAHANDVMESMLQCPNAAASHRERQRTIRQLCVDSDSDSETERQQAPRIVNPTVGLPSPHMTKLGQTAAPPSSANYHQGSSGSSGRRSAEGPQSPLPLPALRSSPHKDMRPSSPTPKVHPDGLPAPKVSSPVITAAEEPFLQQSRGKSPTTYFPPPPVVPPPRTASGEALRHPTPPLTRGPGSARSTPVAASYFHEHRHRDEIHPAHDDEQSFEEVYREYRDASAERQRSVTTSGTRGTSRDFSIARPSAKRVNPAQWESDSPRKSPSLQNTHGSSRISPPRGPPLMDDTRTPHDTLRRQTSPRTSHVSSAPRQNVSITSPDAVYHRHSAQRASPIRSTGSSPMGSVGSEERARFVALTGEHGASVGRHSNPLHSSLKSSAKYKSTSPLPPTNGSATPKYAPTKAIPGRSTPQSKSKTLIPPVTAQAGGISAVNRAATPRANSGGVLSQSGVFATETGQTFGACRCEEHDSLCSFLHEDWLQAFVGCNQGTRSSSRLFNLDPVPLGVGLRQSTDADRNVSPSFRRRAAALGAWCSVDVLQRRRADILPPKRFLVIAGGRLQDADVDEVSASVGSLEASELMLFPQEPFDGDTGLVKALPSASFPLTTRGISDGHADPSDVVGACSAVTFTRVRLAPRKFHFVVEVLMIPLAPLLEEHETVVCGSRNNSLSNSMDDHRRGYAPAHQPKLFEQLIGVLIHGDDNLDLLVDNSSAIVGGATIGLFDAGFFFETYGTLLDITNRNRAWLAGRLRDVFDYGSQQSPRRGSQRQPSELLAQRRRKLGELFEGIRSPLTPLEFRAPPSLWNATVQRTFQLLEQDPNLRSGMSQLNLESLQFRDVHNGGSSSSGNGGILTHDAFGVIKSAVQIPSNVAYDVRCLPQNKVQLYCPQACRGSRNACDGDTAIVLEYISRFPYVQRIYSILADASRFFVVLPPVLSKAVERSSRPAQVQPQDEVMALSDLCRRVSPQLRMAQYVDYVRLVAAQVILSVGLLHSRAVVVGSLTPRRILCKVTHGPAPLRATTIETSLTGIGMSSMASSWLRQQKGVIEYLSPAFISQFLDEKLPDPSLEGLSSPPRAPAPESPPPTLGVADDWWAVGCIIYELLSRGVPLFPVEGKRDLLDMWLTLLVNRDSTSPQSRDTITEVARGNVRQHIQESVQHEADRLFKQWEPPITAKQTASSPSPQSSSSNLVVRRVEERKLEKAQQASPHRPSQTAQEGRLEWKQSLGELVDVLNALCDINNFAPSAHHGLCPSDFHGFVIRLMAMPFFKTVDWVNVFSQTPGSMTTGCNVVAPLAPRTGSSERSHSADSTSKGRGSPRRQLSQRVASSPRLTRKVLNKSSFAGLPMESSEPSEGAGTNEFAKPHPFVMYSAEETAVLVNLLQRKGTTRDRDMAEAVKRQDVRLHQWSAEAVPELSGRNSFLRPTESYQMYQRAVKERRKQLVAAGDNPASPARGSPSKEDPVPSQLAPPVPRPSDVYVMGGASRVDHPQAARPNTISPLHHSYSFQRPKGFIDLVSERKAGCMYNPPPVRNQGDVSVYTKPLLSTGSKAAVAGRHQGYLDPVAERGKGTYVQPPPPPKTFGEAPPLPASHGKDARSRLAQSISRPHPTEAVVDAPQSYRAWIDTVEGSIAPAPRVVVSPPPTKAAVSPAPGGFNLTSVSPETPRSDDPSVALFTSPPPEVHRRVAGTSRSTPSATPVHRAAVRLGPKSDASSDHSSSALHDRSDDRSASEASSRFRERAQSPSTLKVQRPPRHAQGVPVALPPGVASVRSGTSSSDTENRRPIAVTREPQQPVAQHVPQVAAEPEQSRPLPKRNPIPRSLGKWERSDSEDETPQQRRSGALQAKQSKSPKSSPRRPAQTNAAKVVTIPPRELPPPPPPYDPLEDDEDDTAFV